jgi:glycosyl transferase family 25
MSAPVYVINLDRRPDRLACISEDLGRLGLSFTRIAAVDGGRLDLSGALRPWLSYLYEGLAAPKAGSVGCFLSHRKAWSDLLASGAEQGLILEDDAVPREWDGRLLNSDLRSCGLDMLRLGGNKPIDINSRKPLVADGHFALGLKFSRQASPGACAYLLTREGARKCLACAEYWFPVDHFDLWRTVYGVESAVILPFAWGPRRDGSSITTGEPFEGRRSYVKFRRKLRHLTRRPAVGFMRLAGFLSRCGLRLSSGRPA